MNTLILSGSGDSTSHSLSLAHYISEGLIKIGHTVELLDVKAYGLPLYDRQAERNNSYPPLVREFLDKSNAADAFIWVTPIYHNSYSSLLKNALDWQHTKFPGKIVGLASNGGNRSPQAVDHLMSIARAQHLVTCPVRVCTDSSDFDENYELVSDEIRQRIAIFCQEFSELAAKITA